MLRFGRLVERSVASVGAGRRVWAIGDVHGCDDLLEALLTQIRRMESLGEPTRIVFLGDYVDRGPDSRRVLDRLVALKGQDDAEVSCVRGNHDHMMLEFLNQPEIGPAWLAMGAASTLRSYGIEPPANIASPTEWRQTWQAFTAAVPKSHVAFLTDLDASVEEGGYFFTHAGVRPGKSFTRQRPADLMWIRDGFLNDNRRLEKIVVHGHTVTAAPHSDHRRVGVDTGAYASGQLTAVRIDATDRRFLQVRRVPSGRITPFWDVAPADLLASGAREGAK